MNKKTIQDEYASINKKVDTAISEVFHELSAIYSPSVPITTTIRHAKGVISEIKKYIPVSHSNVFSFLITICNTEWDRETIYLGELSLENKILLLEDLENKAIQR